MKLISFSVAKGPTRPGILFDDTKTVLDLSPNGFSSTLEVISRFSAIVLLIYTM